MTQAGRGQTLGQPLAFFKNYFVTGDYVVAGVGLQEQGVNGIATGYIDMRGLSDSEMPPDAEVLGAFLYWQVVTSDGADSGARGGTFNDQMLSSPGLPLTSSEGPLAVVGSQYGTSPCWSSGGGTGSSNGGKRTYTYRADVLRFLTVGEDGRHQVKVRHKVQLPDTGNSNSTPRALGASLVVIYRDPRPTASLNAIVMYDGSYTMDNSTGGMSQTIKGFYDPAPVAGKITHIVGSGQANKSERLLVPGSIVLNPFQSFQGPSWDNVTVETASISGDSLATSVDHVGFSSYDCLNWGAIIYRTKVNDADGDGLLDKWESSTSTLSDPKGNPLPNLAAMGAHSNRKDVFVEAGYMQASVPLMYGGVTKPAHSHLPTHEALKGVGDAFLAQGIDVHFDLGDSFPSGVADPYIIHGASARGGESIDEMATVCSRGEAGPPWVCQFSEYPGTVGWKSGFRFFRDMPLSLSDDACDAADADSDPTTTCERVFDRGRKDMFRYVLFVHALGVPKADCLGADGFPDTTCQDSNPLFHVPVTNTGVGDFPGGDAMLALGAFNNADGNPVGTDYMQAATLMHELGHTFQLRHGGALAEPNCKPNYLSVMNYLFQLRGLLDNSGVPHIDFSGQSLGPPLDENNLSDPGSLGPPAAIYRTGWYASPGPGIIGSAATRHCDGTLLLPGEAGMVRIDTTTVEAATYGELDWNASTAPQGPQDINFDGAIGSLNPGFNDWANLRLNQVGARRNVGAWFWVLDPSTSDYLAFMGPLSLDVGRGDLGRGDLGRGDLGRGDLGRGDLGRGDLGRGDLGRGDLGRGDLGRGDLGRGDLGRGDLGRGDLGRGDLGDAADGEVTSELAAASGYTPPNELTALVQSVGCPGGAGALSPADCHRIRLDWKRSNLASESGYRVLRFAGSSVAGTAAEIGFVATVVGQGSYSLVDPTELPNGPFTYVVRSEFSEGFSASVITISAINDRPVASSDPAGGGSYSTDAGVALNIPGPGVLGDDTDVDSPSLSAEVSAGPLHGAVILSDNGSFTYTPMAGYAGPDSFTYTANDVDTSRSSNEATVSITVLDSTPPIVSLTFPAPTGTNGFFKTLPVAVGVWATDPSTVSSFTCTDGASPVLVGSQSGIGTTAATGILTLTAEGTHVLACSATDGVGNYGAAAGSSNIGTVKIDTVSPTVTITAPANGAAYFLDASGASVKSSYSCTDPAPGSGLLDSGGCTGPVPSGSNFSTSSVGSKTFAVTGTDRAGNTATASAAYYVRYNAVIAQPKNSKLGSAIPLTWELKNADGTGILRLSTLVRLTTVYNGPKQPNLACSVNTTGPVAEHYKPATGATGGSDFRLSSTGYKFNWDTTSVKSTGRGCYTIVWQFDDNAGASPGYPVLSPNLLGKVAVEVQ